MSLQFSSSVDIKGVLVAESITSSLQGTASFATTASYALNVPESASYALTASVADTASYVETALTASFVNTAETASFVDTALTASFVDTALTASYIDTAQTASFAITASYVVGGATVSSASYASYAETASFVDTAFTASFITGSNVSGIVSSSVTASLAHTASLALSVIGNIQNADTASFLKNSVQALALGTNVTASGLYSFAQGENNKAIGQSSQAHGRGNLSSNSWAHTEGQFNSASGQASHAEGEFTKALAEASHAEGIGTIAAALGQHVQGWYNVSSSDQNMIWIVGNGVLGNNFRSNIIELTTSSLLLNGNMTMTGTLTGTASIATLARTASFITLARSASYVQTAQTASLLAGTASHAFTASFVNTARTASIANTASLAYTASYVALPATYSQADTASFVKNAQFASASLSSSNAITASYALSVDLPVTYSNAYSSSITELSHTASYIETASFATFSDTASYAISSSYVFVTQSNIESASFASSSLSASFVQNAQFATASLTASHALTASYVELPATYSQAETASYSHTALTASYTLGQSPSSSYASSSISASYAETASYAEILISTASQAFTASYVNTAETASYVDLPVTYSQAFTASHVPGVLNNVITTGSHTATQIISGTLKLTGSIDSVGTVSMGAGVNSTSIVNINGMLGSIYTQTVISASSTAGENTGKALTFASSPLVGFLVANRSYNQSSSVNLNAGFTAVTMSVSSGSQSTTMDMRKDSINFTGAGSTIQFGLPVTASAGIDGTASFALTASYLDGQVALPTTYSQAYTASFAFSASWAPSAAPTYSQAYTASYSHTASLAELSRTASFVSTSSFSHTASFVRTSLTASFVSTSSFSHTASFVRTSQTASFVTGSNVIGIVNQALTSSFVTPKAYFRGVRASGYTPALLGNPAVAQIVNFSLSSFYTSSNNTKTVFSSSTGNLYIGPGTYKITMDFGGFSNLRDSTYGGAWIAAKIAADSEATFQAGTWSRPAFATQNEVSGANTNYISDGLLTVGSNTRLKIMVQGNLDSAVVLGGTFGGNLNVAGTTYTYQRGCVIEIQEL